MRRHRPPTRRGVAMLLVLISLLAATILATAYLASQDNSAIIGANVADASTARWAAISGLDVGISILQSDADWRGVAADGTLLESYAIGGALIDVTVSDVVTGEPPSDASTRILVTVAARTDSVEQAVSAIADVPAAGGGMIDLDLSEFAIFGGDTIVMEDSATLTRWPSSPYTEAGDRVNIGTRSTGALSVRVVDDAAALDTTLYHGPGASSSLLDNESAYHIDTQALLDVIPMPDPASVPTTPPDPDVPHTDLETSAATTIDADARFDGIRTTSSGGVITLAGPITVVAEGDLRLGPDSGIIVDGHVTLVVFDDFEMSAGSFVELKPGATLELRVFDELSLEDAYVGDIRDDRDLLDNTGAASWIDPGRIVLSSILSVDGVARDEPTWELDGNSVVKATIYAPNVDLRIADATALYGSSASATLRMTDDAAIFYDHGLATGIGYTDPMSPLFDDEGHLLDGIAELGSLDAGHLTELLDLLSDELGGVAAVPMDPSLLDPAAPTPRPHDVAVEIISFGSDPRAWESSVSALIDAGTDPNDPTNTGGGGRKAKDAMKQVGAGKSEKVTAQ